MAATEGGVYTFTYVLPGAPLFATTPGLILPDRLATDPTPVLPVFLANGVLGVNAFLATTPGPTLAGDFLMVAPLGVSDFLANVPEPALPCGLVAGDLVCGMF